MAIVTTDPFSQTTVYLRMKFGDLELATATGFFYRLENRLFLVSNWHNFSGRDIETAQPLCENGSVPDRITCVAFKKSKYIERCELTYRLEQDFVPLWYEHPLHGRRVDVAALPVEIPETAQVIAINDISLTPMRLSVSKDVFVIGYPLGITDSLYLPIWKRASVASEPGTSSPSFLIDTATRKGMSGSPVILRYRGYYKSDVSTPHVSPEDWFGEADDFVGIYSGRLGKSELEAQLGIVWKRHIIEEVMRGSNSRE